MIRCIIAEDEKILRRGLILTTDWNALGCEVIGEAENGQEAYELIKKLSPDLVITDIRMPLMNGLELVEKAQAISHAEFLIISGFNDFIYAKQAIHLGVTDYITKPIDDDELFEALKNTVQKIRKKQQLNKAALPSGNADSDFPHVSKLPASAKNHYIVKAIAYVEQHYQENLSMGDVCKSLLISESYLTKLFKENTDYSFIDYLTNYRIKKACELLKNPTMKIYSIAEQVGYKDQRYFSVLFKKIVGVTPKQFRETQMEL